MNIRAALATLALLCFYALTPFLLGELEKRIFVSAILFTAFAFGVACLLAPRERMYKLGVSLEWRMTLKLIFWCSQALVLHAALSILFAHGVTLTGMNRDDLFLIRESSFNSLTVIGINGALASSGVLALRSRKYANGFLLPVGLEILTQSRGFILSTLLVLFVCGVVSRKVVFFAALGIVGVTLMRIAEPLTVDSLFRYVSAEALNTAVGNSLLPESAYSVSIIQAVRVLLSPFLLVGSVLEIQSEAVVFNEILEATFGYYGMAFGVLGFVKFSTWSTMAASLLSAFAVFWVLLRLRIPPVLFLVTLVTALPTFFRWSPPEFFFIVARVLCTVGVVHILRIALSTRAGARSQTQYSAVGQSSGRE